MEAELWQQPKGLRAKLADSCVIGRSPEADIKVFNAKVSREHVMIRRQASGYWIYDLDSANGTFVNDREVTQPLQLQNGDVIQMADVVFLFHVPGQNGDGARAAGIPDPPTLMVVRKTPAILLVADIMGYSGFSAKIGDAQVQRLINCWYEDCQELILESGGTIDNFLGDGVFAYWKSVTPEARGQAIRAAVLLAAGPRNVPPDLAQLMESRGLKVRCGVGLHIGEPNFGAVVRGTRTALGDDVNLAFRIEAITRGVGQPVLVSGAFLEGWEAGVSHFKSCGRHHLRGYEEPLELFTLVGDK